MWFAVLHGSSTTWFHVRFVTNNISLTSNLYSYNQTMGNSKFNVSTPVDHFFSPTFKDSWFELSRIKLHRNDLKETKTTSNH